MQIEQGTGPFGYKMPLVAAKPVCESALVSRVVGQGYGMGNL